MEQLNEIHSKMLYRIMSDETLATVRELYAESVELLWDYWQLYDADQRARFGDDRPTIRI